MSIQVTGFTLPPREKIVGRTPFTKYRGQLADMLAIGLIEELGRDDGDESRVRIRVGHAVYGMRVDLDLHTGQWQIIPARPKYILSEGGGGPMQMLMSLIETGIRVKK